jgi:hypothetical protein
MRLKCKNNPKGFIEVDRCAVRIGNRISLFFPTSPVLADDDSANPYFRIRLSRLSHISGEVLFQRTNDEEWIPPSLNTPLGQHVKIWPTGGARVELQIDDGTVVRLAGNADVDLLNLEHESTQLQLTL